MGGKTKQDRNEPADRAFSIFSNLTVPKEEKLVVAIGDRASWDKGIIREFDDVTVTVFYEEPKQLESVLTHHLSKETIV